MTRDEAIKIQRRHGPTQLIDILADLGVLKLDKPKNAYEKFRAAMDGLQYHDNSVVWRDIPIALDAAGLKIVEK